MSLAERVPVRNPVAEAETSPLYAAGALAGIAMTTVAFLAPLYYTTTVLGGAVALLLVVGAALGLAFVLGRLLSGPAALGLAVLLLGAGLGGYLLAVPASYWEVLTPARAVGDVVALLTGYSILQMTTAGVWAIGVAPGPVFLTWYLAARGQYVRSATVAALTLGFFVLTGNAGTGATLLGVLGVAAAVAFHTIEAHGGSRRHAEVIAASLALMILASTAVSAVPGGGRSPLVPGQEGGVQGSLVDAGDRQAIGGSIRLSPEVHFTVTADRAAYWRVAAYDRFTGEEWLRTGTADRLAGDGELDRPPGPRENVLQEVTARIGLGALPAAAEPIRVSGVTAEVTDQDTLQPANVVRTNESYVVVSSVSTATPAQLRNASTDDPEGLSSVYTELPESLGSRVGNLTDNITADATSRYEAASTIEAWLERNKRYSLDVDRPAGNIAERFLFSMDQGYCVYYATTMVTMLRTMDIPARYVTGYTSGQRVSEDTWVVRGLDSHAWVEVYFPEYGWIRFDPTPAQVRQFEEDQRVEQARARGVPGVDAAGSRFGTYTPPTTGQPTTTTSNGTADPENGTTSGVDGGVIGVGTLTDLPGGGVRDPADQETLDGPGAGPGSGGGGGLVPTSTSPDTLALWGLLAVGLVAGARRTGASDRVYRTLWLAYQPGGGPGQTVEGAFERVLYLLERRHRPRGQGETIREYLAAVGADDRALEVARLRERCVHAGTVTEADARRARELAGEYVRTHAGTAPTVFNRLIS